MFEDGSTGESAEPKRDLTVIFDLDRKKLTKTIVDRMEQVMREQDAARADLKAIMEECKEQRFSKRDIEAMKKIAKLRKEDKKGAAKEQLEALERIGAIVGFDLFDWASAR